MSVIDVLALRPAQGERHSIYQYRESGRTNRALNSTLSGRIHDEPADVDVVLGVARRMLRRSERLDDDPGRVGFARQLIGQPLDVPLRERREGPERRSHDGTMARFQSPKILAKKIVDGGRRIAGEVGAHHLGDFLEESLPVAVGGIRSIAALDAPDPA